MKTVIIGSGIAGIASAIRMAVRGYEVHVYESNAYPGGKLSSFIQDGYRFDAGPSLFTMPRYVDNLFRLAGKCPTDYFEYSRLDILCKYFWEDGVQLTAYADPDAFQAEISSKLSADPGIIKQILEDSRRKYELTGKTFLEKSLHKSKTWWSMEIIPALMRLYKLDLFTTMHAVNQRLLKHPKLIQFFDRFATYNGSDPYRTPGLLTMIPHLEHGIGAFIPKGGMISITDSLVKLAESLGVVFHYSQYVHEINVKDQRAIGIKISDFEVPADIVVCNMDIHFAYHKLLKGQKPPKKILNQEKSTSALVFFWGIKKQFPDLDLHNIFFSENYKEEFGHLAAGYVSEDPTIYVNITSKLVPEDSPDGCENWFTMINVPHDKGQDWDQIIQKSRQNILHKLSCILKCDIQSLIQTESILDPLSIETKTHSYLGALYGTSSNHRMSAFLRHPNFSKKIKGLYFCGGSVHPGGGIPLCLLSAEIVDKLIQDDYPNT